MSNVEAFFQIDWIQVIIAIILLLVVFKFVWELVEWIGKKLGIEFKWKKQSQTDHDLLNTTAARVDEQDRRIEQKIDDIITSINTIDNKFEKLSMDLDKVDGKLDNVENRMGNDEVATKEIMADRLSQKLRYYMQINGIPESELDDLNNLYAAYRNIGGNHTTKQKYEYCIAHLPIIKDSAGLLYTRVQ